MDHFSQKEIEAAMSLILLSVPRSSSNSPNKSRDSSPDESASEESAEESANKSSEENVTTDDSGKESEPEDDYKLGISDEETVDICVNVDVADYFNIDDDDDEEESYDITVPEIREPDYQYKTEPVSYHADPSEMEHNVDKDYFGEFYGSFRQYDSHNEADSVPEIGLGSDLELSSFVEPISEFSLYENSYSSCANSDSDPESENIEESEEIEEDESISGEYEEFEDVEKIEESDEDDYSSQEYGNDELQTMLCQDTLEAMIKRMTLIGVYDKMDSFDDDYSEDLDQHSFLRFRLEQFVNEGEIDVIEYKYNFAMKRFYFGSMDRAAEQQFNRDRNNTASRLSRMRLKNAIKNLKINALSVNIENKVLRMQNAILMSYMECLNKKWNLYPMEYNGLGNYQMNDINDYIQKITKRYFVPKLQFIRNK